jgi:beta-1,4-mannosyltransferase
MSTATLGEWTATAERRTSPWETHEALQVAALPAFDNKSTNPYNWLLYTHMQAAGQPVSEFSWEHISELRVPDIFHVHWPDHHVFPQHWRLEDWAHCLKFQFYIRFVRLRGGKVIWTAHNAFGHDVPGTRLNLLLWRAFLASIDGVIYLSARSKRELQDAYPTLARKDSVVIQHGDYVSWIAEAAAGIQHEVFTRESLGIPSDAKVILAFGQIRRYKGIDLLTEQFERLGRGDTHLVIAGAVRDTSIRAGLERLAQGAPNIHCILRRTEDAELVSLLRLCDVVVLPYRRVTNSGSALLALSAQRPILGPDMGSLPEVQQLAGADWVRLYDGPLSHAHLEQMLAWSSAPRAPLNLAPFAWPEIARQTLGFYQALRPRARAGASS